MFDRPFFAALAFCAIFYVLLATTSNWPIWMWYYYPIFLCVLHCRQIGEAADGLRRRAAKVVPASASRVAFAVATASIWIACGVLAVKATALPPPSAILEEARFLTGFETTHPGIYGIGDRAALPAMLMRSPIVQLEGLVMDRHMLELLGSRTPLCQILADYKVRYYAAHANRSRLSAYGTATRT